MLLRSTDFFLPAINTGSQGRWPNNQSTSPHTFCAWAVSGAPHVSLSDSSLPLNLECYPWLSLSAPPLPPPFCSLYLCLSSSLSVFPCRFVLASVLLLSLHCPLLLSLSPLLSLFSLSLCLCLPVFVSVSLSPSHWICLCLSLSQLFSLFAFLCLSLSLSVFLLLLCICLCVLVSLSFSVCVSLSVSLFLYVCVSPFVSLNVCALYLCLSPSSLLPCFLSLFSLSLLSLLPLGRG